MSMWQGQRLLNILKYGAYHRNFESVVVEKWRLVGVIKVNWLELVRLALGMNHWFP